LFGGWIPNLRGASEPNNATGGSLGIGRREHQARDRSDYSAAMESASVRADCGVSVFGPQYLNRKPSPTTHGSNLIPSVWVDPSKPVKVASVPIAM
jgi:hypothetical protein